MSTFTVTSRIKSKVEVTGRFDMTRFNPCKVHGIKPRIFEIKWGRNNKELTAECESDECLVFSDVEHRWNEFNPRMCGVCKKSPAEVTTTNGRQKAALWCAPCKAKIIEETRGQRFVQSDSKPWLPSPDDEQDEQGHVWFDFRGTPACKRCGIVRQRDGKRRPCRGTTGGIGLRASAGRGDTNDS